MLISDVQYVCTCTWFRSFFVILPNMVVLVHVKDVGVRFVFSVVVMKGIPQLALNQ